MAELRFVSSSNIDRSETWGVGKELDQTERMSLPWSIVKCLEPEERAELDASGPFARTLTFELGAFGPGRSPAPGGLGTGVSNEVVSISAGTGSAGVGKWVDEGGGGESRGSLARMVAAVRSRC